MGERGGSTHRSGASAPSKVRFHDEVKFKTIKAREGKGLARSIMQLLDDAPDDDEDSFEAESEEEDDDQWGDTQGHSVNENSDAELSSDDDRSQSDVDESPEGRSTLSNGRQTIQRLQDDLLADEDEPDDGTLYFYRISICLCLAIRFIHT
jgi:U3 small nucleolar RNA-associated protein MPP10